MVRVSNGDNTIVDIDISRINEHETGLNWNDGNDSQDKLMDFGQIRTRGLHFLDQLIHALLCAHEFPLPGEFDGGD